MTEEKITFEQAYEKLKAAGEKMDSNDITLQLAMDNYEEGVKYYRICREILEEAKQKIELFDVEEES